MFAMASTEIAPQFIVIEDLPSNAQAKGECLVCRAVVTGAKKVPVFRDEMTGEFYLRWGKTNPAIANWYYPLGHAGINFKFFSNYS